MYSSSELPQKWKDFTRKFNQLVDNGKGDKAVKLSKKLLTKKTALGPDFELYITMSLARHFESVDDLEGARKYYTLILENISSANELKVVACEALAQITWQLASSTSGSCDERVVEEHFKFALQIEPKNISILVQYGQFLSERFFDTRKADIERLFQQAEAAPGNHTEMYLRYAQYLSETAHPITAMPKLETVLERRPKDPEVSFEISLLFLSPDYHRPAAAVECLHSAVQVHQNDIRAAVHLAKLHAFVLNDDVAALPIFETALEFDALKSRCNSFRFFYDMFRYPAAEVETEILDEEKGFYWTRREILDLCNVAEMLHESSHRHRAIKFAERAAVLDAAMGYRLQRVAFVYETVAVAPSELRRHRFKRQFSRTRGLSNRTMNSLQFSDEEDDVSSRRSSPSQSPIVPDVPGATPLSPRSAESPLRKWLAKFDLGHCYRALEENGIGSLSELRQLTMSDLQLTPIRHNDQLLLMRAIKKDLWHR